MNLNFKLAKLPAKAVIATGLVLLTLSACSQSNKPVATVYLAKNIITMNDQQPSASAVVVADGAILAVGNLESVRDELPDYQLDVNTQFEKNVIMPGLIDNHLHPTLAGILLPSVFITPFDWDLPNQKVTGVQGRDAYLATLKEKLAQAPEDEIFITWGYHQYFHGELSRSDLNLIAPGRAVIVWHRSFHEVILNTQALRTLGLNEADFADNPAVDYAKGHFWELGLFSIFPQLAPTILSPARYQAGVLEGFRHAQLNGITTVVDQGFPLIDFDMETTHLNAVLSKYAPPISMKIVGNGKTLAIDGLDKGLVRLEGLAVNNTNYVTYLPKQVKLLADGAFYSQLMQMEDGYLDGHHGEWITPPDELEQAARAYWQAGYQLHIHVNGDKGLNVVLDIIDRLNQEMPRDHQTVLHHYGYSQAGHAARLAELGISVSANPYYLWALADKYAEIGLGPERAHAITRLGDLERKGVRVSLHSDLPMAPASPLTLAGIAASRVTALGNTLMPEEKMSVNEALKAITINAAHAVGLANKIGSIEIGKQADFAVLSADPKNTDPTAWRDIKIVTTVHNGKPALAAVAH